MLKNTLSAVTWLCIFIMVFVSHPAWPQKPLKRKTPGQLKVATCCEEAKELKAQIANLTSLLSELSKKQERDWVSVVMQVMELESSTKRMESRLTDAESKYSEMNNQIDIMQLQAAQTVTQTSADAIYDCSSLYQKNYRISGVYKLPPDDFLGSPELEVRCSVIWRRQVAAGPSFRDGRAALSPSTGTGSSTSRALAASVGTSGWGTNTSTGCPDGRPGYVWRWRTGRAACAMRSTAASSWATNSTATASSWGTTVATWATTPCSTTTTRPSAPRTRTTTTA
ncbi:angiopoietin-related protein 7 isoform X2 [Canis lupus familiaris]|uniref:angiopoietin-related protein 7 isoform X2 n=1 Tax=Canis lupus familiaris TaxID=9615 RepID=UPI000BAA2E53|nr:angiopoietin-related protein 7 isoform X2 [Canis lupus familiaris]XP_038387961.1 angiopoietin-related protein 7 isoform X2 [Canis lupus familiaris]XP_038516298.1 angiopoietin-related protein 7 isoform X2 [Canis lupus familiaris]|eukprot:XP_022270335.1 angiopoietin-related protein 7 isoform X2 [Canis lupus familiaris]